MFLLSPGPAGPAPAGEGWEEAALRHGGRESRRSVPLPPALPRERGVGVSYWKEKIQDVGPGGAYEVLVSFLSADGFTPQEQHLVAHMFGAAAYQIAGVNSLLFCDDQFSYGCQHEVVAHAISDYSIAFADELNEVCASKGGIAGEVCQHGLGHGILEYFGDDGRGLNAALDLCTSLGNLGSLNGCYGGVFMEYNLGNLVDSQPVYRIPHRDGLSYPCAVVSENTQPACFARLPQWWILAVYDGPPGESSSVLGEWCRKEAPSDQLLNACAFGLGRAFSNDLANAKRICASIFREGDNLDWCPAGAAYVYRVRDSHVLSDYCESYASLKGNNQACSSLMGEDLPRWALIQQNAFSPRTSIDAVSMEYGVQVPF